MMPKAMIANPEKIQPTSASATPMPSTGMVTNGSSSRAERWRAAPRGSTSTLISPRA
jgi:hypothetical protein